MLNVLLPRPTGFMGKIWTALNSKVNIFGIFIFSFLMTRAALMGELYPFGTSFLAAVCIVQPGLRLASLAGVVAGTLLAINGWDLVSYLLCPLLLYLILYKRYSTENHWLVVPSLVAAVQLLVRGSAVLLTGNALYDWVGVIFESFFAGVLTLVAINGLQAWPKFLKGTLLTTEERTSMGLIVLGSLVGLAGFEYAGIGLQSVFSRLLVLWGAFLAGPGGGAAVGVGVGLVPTIQGSVTTGPIAVYALAGLLGGVFSNFRKIGVVIGFLLATLFMTLFFADQIVIERAFRETIIAILAFAFISVPGMRESLKNPAQNDDLPEKENRLNIADKLQKTAAVFREISKTFRIEKAKMVEKEELSEIFNKVAARVCEGCSLRRVCWEQDFYKTYRSILEACTVLETSGNINEKQFGANLKRRCMRLRELSMALNSELDHLKLVKTYQKQIEDCREMVNNQLENLARLVEDLSLDIIQEVYGLSTGAEILKKKLAEKGLQVRDLVIMQQKNGDKEILISQTGCQEKDWCRTMVAPNISQITGRNYKIKSMECVQGETACCSYRLIPGNAFQVSIGQAQCPKDGVKVSGDVCSAFALPDQRFALVMSDGMGTGKEARDESNIAIDLLGKLLAAGFSQETAIKTVNTILFLRSGKESFVTLDLILFNRVNGFADFTKIGSAPSLICSSRGLKVVQTMAPPAGILDRIEMQTSRHLLMPGNVIIMMSDGVWEAINSADGPAGWFEDVLKRMDLENPQQLADNILYLAKKASGNKAKDDMSVQVARVEMQDIA